MLIDFRVEREVNVFPMVPQGSSIGEMITRVSSAAAACRHHVTDRAALEDRPAAIHRSSSACCRRPRPSGHIEVCRRPQRDARRQPHDAVVEADDVEQVMKQLYRLIEVLKVSDVTRIATVEREMVLVKIDAPRAAHERRSRPSPKAFDARVVDAVRRAS